MIPDKIRKFLQTGRVNPNPDTQIDDVELDLAIALLSNVASEHPELLLQEIALTSSPDMVPFALSILLAQGPEKYLNHPTKKMDVIDLMSVGLGPEQLLEIVENLKSKAFGRGFGSRPQKMIRRVLESWGEELIINYISKYPKELRDLINLVHPRYHGDRGKLVKVLLEQNS